MQNIFVSLDTYQSAEYFLQPLAHEIKSGYLSFMNFDYYGGFHNKDFLICLKH